MKDIRDNKHYRNLISMCSYDKINFTYNFTQKNFQNLGDIYEIGTFGGAITQALALGSEKFNPSIFTVDLFSWDADKQKKFPELKFNISDDFSLYVKKSLDHLKNIKIYKSNFINLKPQHPIELMFVDAPKKMKYVSNFIKIFSKYWIKNKTFLLFEDYNQFLSYELPATMFSVQDKFDFYTDKSDIVCAKVINNEISKKEIDLMDIRKWDVYEIINNWERILNLGDNKNYIKKQISILMHLIDNGYIEEAKKYLVDHNILLSEYEHKEKFIKRYSDKLL